MINSMEPESQPPNTTTNNGEFDQQTIEFISCEVLEQAYLANRNLEAEQRRCGILRFKRLGEEAANLVGYNVAQPIQDGGLDLEGNPYYILGVRRDLSNKDSVVEYFRATNPFADEWEQIPDDELPIIRGEDPRVAVIGEYVDSGGIRHPREIVLNVIEVSEDDGSTDSEPKLKWWTRFYRGETIRGLKSFATGPEGMKDVCLVQSPSSNRIGMFTRPRKPGNEALGGLGQIGEVTIDTIDEINEDLLKNAKLINTRFKEGEEWGGVNHAIPLSDGRVGVIGHIARRDNSDPSVAVENRPRIYHTFSAIYDPQSRRLVEIKLLAMADEFKLPDGSDVTPKDPLLKHVAFGSAITEPDEAGNVRLFLGVGDAVTGYKTIEDPFAGLRGPS